MDVLDFFIPGYSVAKAVTKAIKYKLTNNFLYESLKDSRKVKSGDVIFVDRGLYKHFGIYVGRNKVIHFAAPNGDFDAENAYVHETTLNHFSDGSEVHVLPFSEEYESGSVLRNLSIMNHINYKLQTPEETVMRAKSMLGLRGLKDKGYNIVFNNCETFAIWCKTNVAESRQVNELLSIFSLL